MIKVPFSFKNGKNKFKLKRISFKLCEPSSIIRSKWEKWCCLKIFANVFLTLLLLFISIPKTWIFFDLNLKFEIFTSKQNTFEFVKYFVKAAAEAPA